MAGRQRRSTAAALPVIIGKTSDRGSVGRFFAPAAGIGPGFGG